MKKNKKLLSVFSILLFSIEIFATSIRVDPSLGDVIPVPGWFSGTISFTSLSSTLIVNGEPLVFEEMSRTESLETTIYGSASVITIVEESGSIIRTTKIYDLDDMADTYLMDQQFSFSEETTMDEVKVLTAKVTGQDLRLTYGPADNTFYMVEDYLNIPAVSGYSKPGNMLYGGLPINYVWGKTGGVAIGVLTNRPGTYALPLHVTNEVTVELGHSYKPLTSLKQQETFDAEEVYQSDVVYISYNQGDYFKPIDRYTQLLEIVSGRDIQNQPTPTFASGALWKTWALDPSGSGYFTQDQVREIAADLQMLGIEWILLDWGWFLAEGDWDPNWDMFNGTVDFENFIDELKGMGFHVGLWFQPIQIDLSDDDAWEYDDYLVRTVSGDIYEDDDGLGLLDPSLPEVMDYVTDRIKKFASMGVENLYIDSQIAQLATPPNFANELPLSSHEALPGLYHEMRRLADTYDMVIEICPDGRSQSILNLPLHVNNIGDPKNDLQLREEFKSLKAMLGKNAIIGTYVDPFEDNGVSGSFLNIMGIGGMIQTMFRDLDNLGRDNWIRTMRFYNDKQLVQGDYLDLYDIGFDYPEGHVVEKDAITYYSFFTRYDDLEICMDTVCEGWSNDLETAEDGGAESYSGSITLRGLDSNTDYYVKEYLGSQNFLTSNGAGEITLNNQSFDREIMYMVSTNEFPLSVGGADSDLFIYPNPTRTELRINGIESVQEAYIYDSQGRLFSQTKVSESSSIDISSLPTGMYFLKLEDTTFKFIKK